ncbi:hypothetical protein O181_130037 [Austropuccinia psidii MF-1]|uniref:Uncharacterized protein n=1 Tax=Austropuccinia psidii MF-1 TaxID=1389203 RepID=A0A9Q3L0E1_9BASI|nr:hypothetical protein [Austropuccinia psidii MF-1]
MPSTRSGSSYKPSRSSQKGYRRDYGRSQSVTEGQGSVNGSQTDKLCHSEADNTVLPSNRAANATRGLSGHIQSHPEGLQQCISAQNIPDPCRSVEKLHEFLPDCDKIPGPSQHLQVTQWMESIDGKEKHDAFDSRMEENNPPPPKQVPKKAPVASRSNSDVKKKPKSSEQVQRQGTSHKTLQTGLQNPKDSAGFHRKCISDGQSNDEISEKGRRQIKISEMIPDILDIIPNLYIAINEVKSHISDKNSLICNNLKTNNLSLNQINETLMCFEKGLRAIEASNNDNSFGNKLNEKSSIIKELTDKYSKFNINGIIETRIKTSHKYCQRR